MRERWARRLGHNADGGVMEEDTRCSGWAKVSLFGHTHAYGFVDVVQIGGAGAGGFGTNMLRVRSPAMKPGIEYTATNLPDNAIFGGRDVRRFLAAVLSGQPATISPIRSMVYFIEGAGRVKIGWTSDLRGRLSALQSASPVPLRVLASLRASRHMELELHDRFAEFRLHGEWFELADPVRLYIESIGSRVPVDDASEPGELKAI
jgi:hypothetical protein